MSQSRPVGTANHATIVVSAWAILVAMTLTSAWLSDHGLPPAIPFAFGTALILALTFVKVFMVGHSFMELRMAPPVLRNLFAMWCAITCFTLVVLAFVL